MFIIIVLLSILNSPSSGSALLVFPSTKDDHIPLVLFGRQLPECFDAARYRTTQDIIWSCLATMFACTWVAVHPNLPGPWDSWWVKTKRRLVTMIYALIAPEFVAIWAMREWMAAGTITEKFNGIYNNSETEDKAIEVVPWCMLVPRISKSILGTVKGGLEECFKGPYRITPTGWTRTHGFFVQMGGFILCEGRTPIEALKFEKLMKMIAEGEVDMPDVTEDEINDKSKGDFLTKLIVVLQTTWFVCQCLARWATHLPVTELEVVTLAFAVLNVVTYALWWKKPQNVLVSIRIQRKSGRNSRAEENAETEEILLRGGEVKESSFTQRMRELIKNGWNGKQARQYWQVWSEGWLLGAPIALIYAILRPLVKMSGIPSESGLLRVPMFSADKDIRRSDVLPISVFGVFFGALHLIPWSFSFPSTAERWLWCFFGLSLGVKF